MTTAMMKIVKTLEIENPEILSLFPSEYLLVLNKSDEAEDYIREYIEAYVTNNLANTITNFKVYTFKSGSTTVAEIYLKPVGTDSIVVYRLELDPSGNNIRKIGVQ